MLNIWINALCTTNRTSGHRHEIWPIGGQEHVDVETDAAGQGRWPLEQCSGAVQAVGKEGYEQVDAEDGAPRS